MTVEWTKNKVRDMMKDIAEKESVEIMFLTKNEGLGGYNYGASGGCIMLAPFVKVESGGTYDGYRFEHGCSNPIECQFITFFHELSHCKLAAQVPSSIPGRAWNDTSDYQYELWITMLGLEYAHSKYGIKFSDEAVTWLIEEAATYRHSESNVVGGLLAKDVDENGYKIVQEEVK